jgi:ABC-type transport system substrate-binding protein
MSTRAVALAVLLLLTSAVAGAAAPDGEMTWAVHVSLAPTWFDPAETPSVITPFMILYALHDALVKPMPGNPMAPGLAESWSMARDGLAYEFVLHERAMFAPIVEPAFLSGQGRRVEHSSFGAVVGMPYSLPYEDIRLKPTR